MSMSKHKLTRCFPCAARPNVKAQLASKGLFLEVQLDLKPVEDSFQYATDLCKQFVVDWTQDAQGLIGLLHKDVLPDLGSTTLAGLLTPEFSGVLSSLEDQTRFTRAVSGASIIRAWSKHFNVRNADGAGTIFSDEVLGSMESKLKATIFFADLSTTARAMLKEIPREKNVALRRKRAKDFRDKHVGNGWGQSLNNALNELVEGNLSDIVEQQEKPADE